MTTKDTARDPGEDPGKHRGKDAGRRPGRPRASADAASGRGTAQDILDAAAALFCTVGYTSTSTYAIAERAGVRQASLYHHFAGKQAILHELLLGTVRPSLRNAELLSAGAAGGGATGGDAGGAAGGDATEVDVPARLWALAHADVELLCAGRDNLGALYFLPELSDERFRQFRELHLALRAGYADLVGRYPGVDPDDVPELSAQVIALVESVILRRREEPDLRAADVAPRVADAVQRLLGVTPERLADVRRQGMALRATLPASG